MERSYELIEWHNNTNPALNEDNLNNMSQAIYNIDGKLVALSGTLMEDVPRIKEDMEILEPAIRQIETNVERSETAADNAEDSALKSEGYAIGEQDGVEVGPGSEYYQNNAKYYAEIANPPIENTVNFTDIITISDAINKAAKDVRLKVEAVQDLHGYTKPWVGGAGKNKLKTTGTSTTNVGVSYTVNSDGTILVNGTADISGSGQDTSLFVVGSIELEGGVTYVLSSSATNDNDFFLQLVGSGISDINTKSGAKTFTPSASLTATARIIVNNGKTVSNITIKPMVCLSTASNPTTFEPYTNICPITGHSEAKVYRDGLNVWDEQTESGGYSSSGSPYSDADLIRSKNYIPVKVGVYYFSANTSGIRVCGYDLNKNFIAVCPVSNNTFTIVDGMSFIRFHINKNVGNICINLSNPSKNGQYEPYKGNVYTIDLGGTRYGGVLDVDTGTLTLTDEIIDSGDLTWTLDSGRAGHFYSSAINNIKNGGYGLCSAYEVFNTGANTTKNGIISLTQSYGTGRIFAVNTAYTDAATFTTSVTGQKLVYELATPQTIQLTPTQVYLLYGYNTLFGDCGDISLTYDASGIIHIEEAKLDTETLKTIAAASSDFADFKARIAAL